MAKGLAKILLVDDQPGNLAAIGAVLASLNQTILTAISGPAALKLLLEHDFAVILLDVKMPTMDGFETARLIRARERSRHVPIIFLTAYDRDRESTTRAYALGAVDFIYKPVEVDDIIRSKVSVFVQLHEARELEKERTREQQYVGELEAALDQYRQMVAASSLSVVGSIYAAKPLRETACDLFSLLAVRYGDTLELALESRAVKIDHDVPGQLRQLAEEFGILRGGPRDVIEMHTKVLAERTAGIPAAKSRALVEEGRFRVLELMGHLASFYRRYYTQTMVGLNSARNIGEESMS